MKTVKLTSAVTTLIIVLFMSYTSIADSCDLNRSIKKSQDITNTSDQSLSYLHFNVNDFLRQGEIAVMELPAASEFEYLRFDVNNFNESNPIDLIDLPANNFEYLRFNVNNFNESIPFNLIDLPVNDFEYLRPDVCNYTTPGMSMIDELPVTE